jgi:transposase
MVSTMKMVDTKKRPGQGGSVSGVRINRTGRRTYTSAYKRDVVRQCSEAGVSVAAVAMQNGINANLVRRWIVRQRRELVAASAKPPPAMLPVAIDAAATVSVLEAGIGGNASSKPKCAAAASIEIELYGARIHLRGGVDADVLRSVLDALRQR